MITVSVIIPVHNAAATLERCIRAIQASTVAVHEVIVVDDSSTDASVEIARRSGARVIEVSTKRGPASARNFGARLASGEILLFIDADVCIRRDTILKISDAFENEASMDALIGSYDFEPGAPNFLSQYKNLLHTWMHQTARRTASTFWTGCGAIRRALFLSTDGFSVLWSRPAVEDIEFGTRLIRAGAQIRLDSSLQVTHLKRWTLGSLLRSDIFDRAIPWTMLILRDGRMPNDLNTGILQRVSVALICAAPFAVFWSPKYAAGAVACAIALNLPFYRFLTRRRGLLFALRTVPMHLLYFLYSGAGLIAGSLAYAFSRQRAHKTRVAASAR